MKRPQTIDELATLRAMAMREGRAIRLCGSGSSVASGMDSLADDSAVSTQRLNRIIDCDLAGGLVRVEAGITIDALQQQLMFRGRWLGIDASAPNGHSGIHRTIGGLLLTDSAGLLRGWRGGWGRLARAATCIDGAGRCIESVPPQSLVGAVNLHASPDASHLSVNRVEMPWLVEITLQMAPPPADERALVLFCERAEEARAALDLLRQLPARPGYAGLMNRTALRNNRLMLPMARFAIITGFLGTPSLNVERAEILRSRFGARSGETLLLPPAPAGRLRHWVGSAPAGPLSLSVRSADPIATMQALEAADPTCWLVADVLEGMVRGTLQIAPALVRAYLTRGETIDRVTPHPPAIPALGD